ILDRFELVMLDYQSEDEEIAIVTSRVSGAATKETKLLPRAAVRLARITRDHPRVRRGASVRAALSVAEIATVLIREGAKFEDAFLSAALMALPTRIEIEREAEGERSTHSEVQELLQEWTKGVLDELTSGSVKKKF
ncbi:MAG: hypothetical protein ACXVBW_15300, partial [Bdellovibrionota bacterium]